MSSDSSSSAGPSSPKRFKLTSDNLTTKLTDNRKNASKSVLEFNFKKKRVRVLSTVSDVKEKSNGIIYWMSRDARVQDNWAFLYAQKLALKNKTSLHVCFCLVPKFLDATIRHFKFMLNGLKEVEEDCHKLNINFHLLKGQAGKKIPEFVEKHKIGGVVCDFSPLRVPKKWVEDVQENLPEDIPFCQVDAHNVVPVWVTSDKQEYAARTIRNKINKNLNEYLTDFPALIKHPFESSFKAKKVNWKEAFDSLEVDQTVDEVKSIQPGYKKGIEELNSFCEKRLKIFDSKRNDPTVNALSGLSPWFHFGQISVQRAVLTVKEYKSKYSASVDAFCEEAIVRRELSDNFCFYNENYDNLNGLHDWARTTLNAHKKDKRDYLYTRKEFDEAKTHDDLWNSAQIQLKREGKMHGFLRMYWAKKILEWTKSPEEALEFSIYLNDRYNLDGRDPNGYVGKFFLLLDLRELEAINSFLFLRMHVVHWRFTRSGLERTTSFR